MALNRNKPRPLRRCTCGSTHVVLTYDVANDEDFVACMTCGNESVRCQSPGQAKSCWSQQQLSRRVS